MQTALKMKQQESCTQFYLTTKTITKLNTFKLTPTAKLVLLYLTTCYNPKHKEVFPKQKTIADKLGISERSVTRAIQELFKEGLVLIECKYTNRYKFTSKIVQEQAENLSTDLRQNYVQQSDNLSVHDKEQKRLTKKEQNVLNKGGNVYNEDDEILKDYAEKHKAKNVNAYIRKLKESGSATKIIKEYKQKTFIQKRAENTIKETESLLRLYTNFKKDAVMPETCTAWVEMAKKFGIQKKLQKKEGENVV